MNRRLKKRWKEVIGYKRPINTSRSGGPERKRSKVQVKRGVKRSLPTSTNGFNNYRKKVWREEAGMPERDTGRYNFRAQVESRPSSEQIPDQGGPVRNVKCVKKSRRLYWSPKFLMMKKYIQNISFGLCTSGFFMACC
ncbi:hypothetical protein TNIN_489331 [Trichonephila inaurata madagascariensis]|uniref:Uncharacterized protein n=1 Tax=Trichonephila inaurata madagascariensis TaxID=2747483 RepID=A0A8X6XJQ4_9ARAC|nr:hypothetical protein TNIN_489331 [Trichonephila inaurata madagascariensis]